MTDTPLRLTPASPEIAATHALLTAAFAYMDGRIDPPSSLARMPVAALAQEAGTNELWIIPGPLACVILTPKPDHLYIGKLAVADAARGRGLARRLLTLAETRAKALGLPRLQLQTRVELTENHATFAALGFRETGRSSHPGFDRPTSLTFARDL
ncbi:acetyltransferase [Primorskyibacter flagellatus]|uniref:Acetyltransferase n=1 Tax=Primorskyibacter flagellatus TaxID=1387277 RepID=A0A917EIU7_9RHOB|nr:GNAT family N-acetyltransferase [Primorskyibacter flagellatus]GGE41764.1 acetyltransferase [Primorskyibacter flagellatus]